MSSASVEVCGCCRSRTFQQNEDGNLQELEPLVSHSERILPQKDYESLDYNLCYNQPYGKYVEKQEKDKYFWTKLELTKWIVTFFIGFLTAMVALFIDVVVKYLSTWKFETVDISIKHCMRGVCVAVSLLLMLLFNVGYVLLAAVLTAFEPVAAGSGIPEIKCYLNGVKVPRVVRLKTLISKAVGVLFSVAGGLFVGKEGPMIHSGAVIGAGVPQFQSLTCTKLNCNLAFFRTDRDKRDFVSGGAAAGVAAAFGAPIGGVLFSLEEGSSFWNQKLTWRTFFCSMAATFSLNFFLSGLSTGDWGYFYLPGLINFGVFKCDSSKGMCHLWNSVDLFIFIIMGFVGGLLGALFNTMNKFITKFRMRHIHRRHCAYRILDAVVVAVLTTLVAFLTPLILGECRILPVNNSTTTTVSPPSDLENSMRAYFCPDGYYNDMATLFFNSQEDAIKELFHQGEKFSIPTLSIYFVFFFLLMCLTYGTSVPSGLFVPCLLCGAAYGRLIANILENVLGYTQIYSGTFALVGAAAFLGGVVRMTISLTVILIESTNEISYGLPIMIVLMVAKWSGDLFTEGIYDLHIELKGVPLLHWEAPPRMERVCAGEIMSSDLCYIYPKSRVQSIIQILRTTAHQAFPVVTVNSKNSDLQDEQSGNETGACVSRGDTSDEELHQQQVQSESYRSTMTDLKPSLHFKGIILRSQLTVLLQWGIFYSELEDELAQPDMNYEDMTRQYPRYPGIFDLDLTCVATTAVMDVTPYMNACPYTVSPDMPVPEVFNLFRSMGLRHLPVVTTDGEIQGIITRHNLTEEHLKQHQA